VLDRFISSSKRFVIIKSSMS